MLTDIQRAFKPNQPVRRPIRECLIIAWLLFCFALWFAYPSPILPKPVEVLQAFGTVWNQSLLHELNVSFTVYLEAMAITAFLSLVFAYATVLPIMRPPAAMIAKSRFLGLAGLTFLFTILISGAHGRKVALLVFSMAVFTLDSLAKMVASVSSEEYDHARTLRMSEWRVVWEVVVLGRRDEALEILRQNAAIGWTMLPMVEGIIRSEGGIGAMLLAQSKHFHLAEVFAIQFAILAVGLGQDVFLGKLREFLCPYADMKVDRR